MISVKDQYYFIFDFENLGDFLEEEDLISFTVIEQAGGFLPEFSFNFIIRDDNILLRLHEGTKIIVSYGKDEDDLTDSILTITSLKTERHGEDRRTVYLTGLYRKIKYTSHHAITISPEMTSFDAIQQVAGTYFTPIVWGTSDDAQKWIQYNISPKKFLSEIYLHSHVPESFPLYGITTDGLFLLKDIKSIIEKDYVWRLVTKVSDAAIDIVYEGDIVLSNNAGFINNWVGYGRRKLINKIESGELEILLEDSEPVLALTNKLTRDSDFELGGRMDEVGFLNDNVHPNYWKAALHNLINLAIFSSNKITLGFNNDFRPVKILDLIMFKNDEVVSGKSSSLEAITGLYIITKVSRTLSNKQFTTVIEVCRESFNSTKGNLR